MTLAEFLLTRIAEDEAAVRKAEGYNYDDLYADFEWWKPSRLLAECDAKRRIVQYILEADAASTAVDNIELGYGVARDLLGLLALPYADHPDYQESWKP
jgi:hypothetical protein